MQSGAALLGPTTSHLMAARMLNTASCAEQDAGATKPDPRVFQFLLRTLKEDYSIEKADILHVAQVDPTSATNSIVLLSAGVTRLWASNMPASLYGSLHCVGYHCLTRHNARRARIAASCTAKWPSNSGGHRRLMRAAPTYAEPVP